MTKQSLPAILFLVFALCSTAHAFDTVDPRFSRLLVEPVLAATVRALEIKDGVTCKTPVATDVSWMCNPNSSSCNFIFQVNCPFNSHPGSISFSAEGFDTGGSAEMESFRISPLH